LNKGNRYDNLTSIEVSIRLK